MTERITEVLSTDRRDGDAVRDRPRPAPLTLQIFADSSDADLAGMIARRLADEGHQVVGGAHDPDAIDAVIVTWSAGALKSPAMLAAARAAQATTPIIPISVDAASPPPDFPEPRAMPLDGWSGDGADPRWRFVVDELALIALRRAPAGSSRVGSADNNLYADEWQAQDSLAASPRPMMRARTPSQAAIDGRSWVMAAAAIFLFAAFAFLPQRAKQSPIVDAEAPAKPLIVGAAATMPPSKAAPPAVIARVGVPARTPTPVDTPAPAHIAVPQVAAAQARPANVALAFQAPPPSLKPKRTSLTAKAPHIKPAGVVDPLAALIVKTTDKAAAKSPKAFQDCSFCPPMLRVSAGKLASAQEHQIAVARAFALGAHEVTFSEWDACVVDGGCRAYRPADVGWGRGGRPVVNVSFDDATAYADWLSAKTGAHYRLPTDEEWTYAAASGGARPIAGGKAPAAAAGVPADARGARGLLGNVWEWTADCTDWDRSGVCTSRIIKGGAWNTGEWRKTPQHSLSKPEGARDFDLGFRVVRDIR